VKHSVHRKQADDENPAEKVQFSINPVFSCCYCCKVINFFPTRKSDMPALSQNTPW